MDFKTYLNTAWSEHAGDPQKVFEGFASHFELCQSDEQVVSLANLIVHVSGEHLGQWTKGIELIDRLEKLKPVSDPVALNRCRAILHLCKDPAYPFQQFDITEQVRILAVTSSALASQKEIQRAGDYLKYASTLASEKLNPKDPAIKSLAITGNNLACTLEEKDVRTNQEVELMKNAALMGRKYWELAGSWMEVERAEYRLAKTFLQANDNDRAGLHAQLCSKIVAENGNDPIERFFALEVLTLVAEAKNEQAQVESLIHQMEQVHSSMSADDQSWTLATLEKMKAL